MLTSTLQFTDHAVTRMNQRNLDEMDIDYVCEHGTRFIRAGVLHIFLGRRDIPESDQRYSFITRLIGTTILIDSHDTKTVLTAYRNRESIRKDRRKQKFNSHKLNVHTSIADLPLAV